MEIKSAIKGGVVAEIELSYKPHVKSSELPQIQDSKSTYNLFIETWETSKLELVEQFKGMFLSRANRVIGICTFSTGGTAGTVVDIKLLFVAAIKCNASAIIVAHNHPSGTLKPSTLDTSLTKRIKDASTLLDIPLLDHVIVTKEGYYSFADDGKL